MLKKVKELTVEELIELGKADKVKNLRITIDGTDDPNKHFDVNIGGVGYGRKLSLEEEIEIPVTAIYTFLFRLKHQYGKVKFVDTNEELVSIINVENIPDISADLYYEKVVYTELLPTDNPYRDELVACIRFIDKTKDELINMKS